ncbi:glyoxalase/bleomycin resistance/dioxygenase family protein, partial [Vibrio parahaemolyticus]
MFTAQWFSLGGMRCSPLNAALVRDWHRSSKVLVFIGFV